jgi:hypothetical protein
MPSISDAFLREAGANWEDVVQKVEAYFQKMESSVEEIVNTHLSKHRSKERLAFQEKLSKCLLQTKELIDAPPEAIHAIFKLGGAEILQLAKFTKRNNADIDLVEIEDIMAAQDDARVKTVMES